MANFNIDYLVVAGGGSGGSTGDNIGAGGGGAGGFITSWSGGSGGGQVSQPTLTRSTQVPYTVTVGSGGIAPTAYYDGAGSGGGRGLNGTASIFDSVSATGGGGGGGGGSGNQQIAGGDGGSGGGGASYYTGGKGNNIGSPVQGFDGGTASGVTGGYRIASGGGGAGSAGNNGGTSTSGTIGQGGSGMSYASGSASITNLSATYAGGGGGGTGTGTQSVAGGNDGGGDGGAWQGTSNPAATNGANTGSGGGGGAGYGGQGGNGGSGVVILRYTTSDANYTTTGITPTETTIGGETILSFTTVGTGAITFTTTIPPIPPFSGTRVTNPVTGFESSVNIGLKLPSGTNDNFPTAIQGMIRNDTSETTGSSASAIIHYNGADWKYFAATESADNPIVASQNFNTVLYNGNGGTQIIDSATVGFQPDLVWIKQRTGNNANHLLVDTVRGPWKVINTNTTSTVDRTSADMTVTSFADGFTVKGTSAGLYECNGVNGGTYSGNGTYVSWCFKAGGTAVSNTDGSITSQVSANVAAGFSIVKYNSGTSAITAGHGLSQAVEMVICKPLVPGAWSIWSKDMATDLDKNYMPLTTATVVPNASSLWNYSNWGATKIGSNNPLMFGNSNDVICYCWHSVAGYSKIGSYIGNGNAVGTIVPLDFEPAWVMIKGVDEASSWLIIDNKRSPTNPASARLDADSSAAEYSGDVIMDLNSDGFQLKTASAGKNALNKTFIYMAFAAS